jgi:hypothetical protein
MPCQTTTTTTTSFVFPLVIASDRQCTGGECRTYHPEQHNMTARSVFGVGSCIAPDYDYLQQDSRDGMFDTPGGANHRRDPTSMLWTNPDGTLRNNSPWCGWLTDNRPCNLGELEY